MYSGRDDKIFRGAIAESGFGGFIPRHPGGLNNTAAQQYTYDLLVNSTSCAPTVDTPASIECLRNLPFDELNAVLNSTLAPQLPPSSVATWPPVLDGDFVADFPANQLASGRFVHVPAMTGTNSDEGTAFGSGRGPGGGGVNTNADMAAAVAATFGPEAPETTGESADELVNEVLYLYPDIQAVGIPSLEIFPEIITPGSALAGEIGLQYRRACAYFGDL